MRIRAKIMAGAAILMLVAPPAFAARDTDPAAKPQARETAPRTQTRAQNRARRVVRAAPSPVAAAPSSDSAAAQVAAAVPPPSAPPEIVSPPNTVSALTNPPSAIASAKVMGADGTVVGMVQKIEVGASGQPSKVDVALNKGGRTVTLNANEASYDAIDNLVVASRSSDEIAALPGIAPQGRG